VAAVTLAAAAMVAMAGGECGCGGREEVVRAVLGTLEGGRAGWDGHARDIVVGMCRPVNLSPKAQGIGC
jgi:hypothetical protein